MFQHSEYQRIMNVVQKAFVQYWEANYAILNHEKNTAKKNQYADFFKSFDKYIVNNVYPAVEQLLNSDSRYGGTHSTIYKQCNGQLYLKCDSILLFAPSKIISPKFLSNGGGILSDDIMIEGESAYTRLKRSVDIINDFGKLNCKEMIRQYRNHPYIYGGIEELTQFLASNYGTLDKEMLTANELSSHYIIRGTKADEPIVSKILAANEKSSVQFSDCGIRIGDETFESHYFVIHQFRNTEQEDFTIAQLEINFKFGRQIKSYVTGVPVENGVELVNQHTDKEYKSFIKMMDEGNEIMKGKRNYEH